MDDPKAKPEEPVNFDEKFIEYVESQQKHGDNKPKYDWPRFTPLTG